MGKKNTARSSVNRPPSPKPSFRSSTKPSSKQPTPGNKPKQGSEATQPGGNPQPQNRAHQRKVLSVFQAAFQTVLSSRDLNATLQEVKTALFNRDFDKAFGNEVYLDTYAARWSPTRALCYASVLSGITPHLDKLTRLGTDPNGDDDGDGDGVEHAGAQQDTGGAKADNLLNVISIGGGAAEIVALASFLGQRQQQQQQQPTSSTPLTGAITLIDVAPWTHVVEKLRAGLTTPPPLSKYASAMVQAANKPVVEPERLAGVTFMQEDVLSLGREEMSSLFTGTGNGRPVLVTLLFTLNELFTAGGLGKTTAFLLSLTGAVPAGSLLLVIDSPGSYSEAAVGKESKRYPMQWLLDRILLQTAEGAWEKVEAQDSAWFRLSTGLEYPIPLEDMRYQMHLYRANGNDSAG